MRLSNSSLNTHTECGLKYKKQYIQKRISKYKGSPLIFGSAIDQGLNELLTTRDLVKAKKAFLDNWTVGPMPNQVQAEISKNPFVQYSKADFDPGLLEKADWGKIFGYAEGLGFQDFDLFKLRDAVHEQGFQRSPEKNRRIYNYSVWLTLGRKADILLETYERDILPIIKRVVSLQQELKLEAGEDHIIGFADLIVELDDGTIVLGDNKTSSVEYDEYSLTASQQLNLYALLVNSMTDEGKLNIRIDKIAYFVLNKKLVKTVKRECESCGYVPDEDAKHTTCNAVNTETGKRCGGKWKKETTYMGTSQILIGDTSERMQDLVLESFNNTYRAIHAEIYTPNLNSCVGKFGKCVYYDDCHNGNTDDYVTITEEKK